MWLTLVYIVSRWSEQECICLLWVFESSSVPSLAELRDGEWPEISLSQEQARIVSRNRDASLFQHRRIHRKDAQGGDTHITPTLTLLLTCTLLERREGSTSRLFLGRFRREWVILSLYLSTGASTWKSEASCTSVGRKAYG